MQTENDRREPEASPSATGVTMKTPANSMGRVGLDSARKYHTLETFKAFEILSGCID